MGVDALAFVTRDGKTRAYDGELGAWSVDGTEMAWVRENDQALHVSSTTNAYTLDLPTPRIGLLNVVRVERCD